MTDFDILDIVPLLGVVVGMAVGLVGIWNTIKARQAETKKDIQSSAIASETRLKEFMEVRFKVVDAQTIGINQRIDRQINDLKDIVKEHSEDIRRHIGEREIFFRDWIQRVEDEIDCGRHSKTQK